MSELEKRQIRHITRYLDGRCVRGSGSKWYAKGDYVVGQDVLFELKATEKNCYVLGSGTLRKIRREARKMGKRFGMVIVSIFGYHPDDFVVMSLEDFVDLMEEKWEK